MRKRNPTYYVGHPGGAAKCLDDYSKKTGCVCHIVQNQLTGKQRLVKFGDHIRKDETIVATAGRSNPMRKRNPARKDVTLTKAQIEAVIKAGVGACPVDAIGLVWEYILGMPLSQLKADIRPQDYSLPTSQVKQIVKTIIDKLPGDLATQFNMTWMNVAPSAR